MFSRAGGRRISGGAPMGRVIALDVGTKTIGVALSDPTRMLASPVLTIARRSVARDVAEVQKIIVDRSVDAIVVGLPYELEGGERRSAKLARQVGDALAEATSLPVTYIDERFSSVDAELRMREAGFKRTKRDALIDAAAAALILQSFLDHGDWTKDAGPP
jgi:putative Holliday junction resolvase